MFKYTFTEMPPTICDASEILNTSITLPNTQHTCIMSCRNGPLCYAYCGIGPWDLGSSERIHTLEFFKSERNLLIN